MANIIAVDDDADVRSLLTTALQRDGPYRENILGRQRSDGRKLQMGGLYFTGCDDAGARTDLPPASASGPLLTVRFYSSLPEPKKPILSGDSVWEETII